MQLVYENIVAPCNFSLCLTMVLCRYDVNVTPDKRKVFLHHEAEVLQTLQEVRQHSAPQTRTELSLAGFTQHDASIKVGFSQCTDRQTVTISHCVDFAVWCTRTEMPLLHEASQRH